MKTDVFRIIIICFLISFSNSCKSNKPKNGFIEEHNVEGVLISRIQWLNDYKNGIAISYYSNGNLKSIHNYRNDTLDGGYCNYFKDQKLKQIGKYVNGKFSGSNITFFKNGKIDYVDQYYNGEAYCHGEFDSIGKVITKEFFIIETSSSKVKLGGEFVCRIKIYNPSELSNIRFWLSDLFPTGAPQKKIGELKIINNEVVYKQAAKNIGMNIFSGVVLGEIHQKFNIDGVIKDTILNAVFPIYELYEVQ